MKSYRQRMASNTIAFRISAGMDIGITRRTIRELGKPQHLEFWWCNQQNALFIGACESPTVTSIPVPDYFYHYTNGQKIKNYRLRRVLERQMHMQKGDVTRIPGTYIPELNMVAFYLCDAERGASDAG